MNTKPLHSEHIQIGQLGISQDGDRFLRLTIRLGQRRRRELLSPRARGLAGSGCQGARGCADHQRDPSRVF